MFFKVRKKTVFALRGGGGPKRWGRVPHQKSFWGAKPKQPFSLGTLTCQPMVGRPMMCDALVGLGVKATSRLSGGGKGPAPGGLGGIRIGVAPKAFLSRRCATLWTWRWEGVHVRNSTSAVFRNSSGE